VQPRNKKIMSKIGIGIPRSQSKMYPVAPTCLNLSLKCILISFFLKIARERAAGLQKVEGEAELRLSVNRYRPVFKVPDWYLRACNSRSELEVPVWYFKFCHSRDEI